MKRCCTFLFLGVFLLASPISRAADVTTLEIGAAAPDFNLPGIDGKNHTLHEYDQAKILVILFTCNHCPTAQAYEERVLQLDADYKNKGVKLVAINPNDPNAVRLDELGYTEYSDSLDEMKLRAAEHHFTFPYLYDGKTQSVSLAYGVQATPHIYIFDSQRKLRYVGAIDDSEVKEVHQKYAREALDALLAGKPVPTEKTHVFGCSTKWIDKTDSAKTAIAKWDQEPVSLAEVDAAGVKKIAANQSENLRLVNIWATWCGPCVEEIPDLVAMKRMYGKRDFEVVTISMDEIEDKAKALKFLQNLHVAETNYIFNGEQKDALVNALDPKWEGPVPHTMLIAPGGTVIYRHTGRFDAVEVKKAIVSYIGRTYAPQPKLEGVKAAK
ncbi:MAG TPA: redoxin domain-containing protein [Humisphaera sp.]|jgi:thiol-disulfide isomerase/thioredoxin|nr:redoxin domain-containing protein [Humisphaera sp.]